MSTETNKATVLRWMEAMNQKDLAVLDQLADVIFAPNFVEHDPGFPSDWEGGMEGIKKWGRMVIHDNPGFHIAINDILADGDKVISRGTVTLNDTATGKPFTLLLLAIDRFIGNQIVEEWELGVPGHW